MSDMEGYAGELAPPETWERLRSDPRATLVDVRTEPEWAYVGIPDLAALDKQPLLVSWQVYPSKTPDPAFESRLRAAGITPDTPLFLLCRSGVRSRAAARHLTALGYAECWNIIDGFEGQLDQARHRGKGGWRAAGLPWLQS